MAKINLTETKSILHLRAKVLNEKRMEISEEIEVKKKNNIIVAPLPVKKRLNWKPYHTI